LLGQAASRQGDWTSAATEFEKSLKLNPNFDQAMTGLARALHRAGKHVPAQRWLRRALRLNPNNYRAWYQLARVQSRRDKSAAAASLQKVLSIQPNFSPALRDLGLLRIQEKKYTEAAKNLEKAVQFGLTDPATHNYLGIAYSRTNRLDGAVDSYRRALASDPDFAEAHLNLALAYQRLKRITDAQREYEIACRLKKNFCQYVPRPQE
jgi:tetratricopeptide (TPR) repeat protein